ILMAVRNATLGASDPFPVGKFALIGGMLGLVIGWFAGRFTSNFIPTGVGIGEAARILGELGGARVTALGRLIGALAGAAMAGDSLGWQALYGGVGALAGAAAVGLMAGLAGAALAAVIAVVKTRASSQMHSRTRTPKSEP